MWMERTEKACEESEESERAGRSRGGEKEGGLEPGTDEKSGADWKPREDARKREWMREDRYIEGREGRVGRETADPYPLVSSGGEKEWWRSFQTADGSGLILGRTPVQQNVFLSTTDLVSGLDR